MMEPTEPTPSGPRKELRRETLILRAVPGDEDNPNVDLVLAAEIFNSGVLTAEISAANPGPDFEV